MAQELANDDIWPVCDFDRPPSRRTISRFINDLSSVVEDVFSRILRQVLGRVEVGMCFRIDGTDVRAPRPDEDASWSYDSTAEECYYGYGCCLVTTDDNIPIAAAFTPGKSVDKETARRITQDALAVEQPVTFVGDAEFDMLDWHDDLIEAGVVPVAPYNPRNTNDPPDIEIGSSNESKNTAILFECGRNSSTTPTIIAHRSKRRSVSARISASELPKSEAENALKLMSSSLSVSA